MKKEEKKEKDSTPAAAGTNTEIQAGEEKAVEDVLIGTSAKLFGDTKKKKEAPREIPSTEKEEEKKGGIEEETPKEVSKYLNEEDFGDRKVKVKIAGVEKEVSFKDLLRGYQTDQYLTQKGQKLAEEAKSLGELRAEILKMTKQESTPEENTDNIDIDFYNTYIKPHTTPLQKEIESIKATLRSTLDTVAPIQYQANLEFADKIAKEQGFTDFKEYLPKIREVLLAMPYEEAYKMDTIEGTLSIYKDIKLQELFKASKKSANPDERPKPKVIPIEKGSGSPAPVDEEASYQDIFKKAKETGDWTEVLKQKGII